MNGLQTVSDLAALARAGFKVDDIKEIIAQGKEEAKPAERPAENIAEDATQPDPEKAMQNAEAEPKPSDESKYKQKYDDAIAKINELEETLKKAQALNTSQTITGSTNKVNDADVINNAFRNLL